MRRSDERAALNQVDETGLLRAEGATHTIVRVEADSIVVEDEGANYAPAVKRENKKARRARQQQRAREQQEAGDVPPLTTASDGDGSEEPPVEAVVADAEEGGAGPCSVSGRLTNALYDALEEEEDGAEAGEDGRWWRRRCSTRTGRIYRTRCAACAGR